MRSKYHTINWVQYLAKYGIANKNNPFFTTKKGSGSRKKDVHKENSMPFKPKCFALFSIDIYLSKLNNCGFAVLQKFGHAIEHVH